MGVTEGIRNIVIGCPGGVWQNDRVEGEPRELGKFYARLLGWSIIRHDWIKVGPSLQSFPHLAFGDGWAGPGLPRQAHLDLVVADLDDALDAAVSAGGTVEERIAPDHAVVADPMGHQVCVRRGDGTAAIGAIVFDCAPGQRSEMAAFYEGLLGSRDGIEFEEIDGFQPTTWPDPEIPEQIHLDLQFADRDAAVARAEALGARRLPRPTAGPPVFADPAGHPLCLCTLTGN